MTAESVYSRCMGRARRNQDVYVLSSPRGDGSDRGSVHGFLPVGRLLQVDTAENFSAHLGLGARTPQEEWPMYVSLRCELDLRLDEEYRGEEAYRAQPSDPALAITGLDWIQSVEVLLSGLYRIKFHIEDLAIVDVERGRIAFAEGVFRLNHLYGALYAAYAHHALYGLGEGGSAAKKALAGAYYRLEDHYQEHAEANAQVLGEVALAAREYLLERGGEIELNPEDLLRLVSSTDIPPSEELTRLEAGESEVYEEVCAQYEEAMRNYHQQEGAPELDFAAAKRARNAISAYVRTQVVEEMEPLRSLARQTFLGRGRALASASQADREAALALGLDHYLEYAIKQSLWEEDSTQEFDGDYWLQTGRECYLHVLAHEFVQLLESDSAIMRSLLPEFDKHLQKAQTLPRHQWNEANRQGSFFDALTIDLERVYSQCLHEGLQVDDDDGQAEGIRLSRTRFQELFEEAVASRMQQAHQLEDDEE